MPNRTDLPNAMLKVGFSEEVVWLAKRVGHGEVNAGNTWLDRVNVPIQFYRAVVEQWPASIGRRAPLTVASHDREGEAVARYVRRRAFLEWRVPGAVASPDGAHATLIVLAVRRDVEQPHIWCWICDTLEEDEYAEAFFGLGWDPGAVAYSRGLTPFPTVKMPQR